MFFVNCFQETGHSIKKEKRKYIYTNKKAHAILHDLLVTAIHFIIHTVICKIKMDN